MTEEKVPNPGSNEAIEQGCTCPVMDNSYGKGYLMQEGLFVINQGCPLHDTSPTEEEEKK